MLPDTAQRGSELRVGDTSNRLSEYRLAETALKQDELRSTTVLSDHQIADANTAGNTGSQQPSMVGKLPPLNQFPPIN